MSWRSGSEGNVLCDKFRFAESFSLEIELTGLLSDRPVVRTGHTGSTAIQGIWSESTVDVMAEISECSGMKDTSGMSKKNGADHGLGI